MARLLEDSVDHVTVARFLDDGMATREGHGTFAFSEERCSQPLIIVGVLLEFVLDFVLGMALNTKGIGILCR